MWTDPVVLLWILIVATGVMRWKKWSKAFSIIGSSAILWLLIISTPFIPKLLINSLERHYLPFDTSRYAYIRSDSVYIVVLASGYNADEQLPPSIQLTETSLVRLVEGIRIQRFFPKSILITTATGNTGAPYSLAQVQAWAANSLGILPKACLPIPSATNTKEEAIACRAVCSAKYALILVTSANHLPRAMMHFRNAGLNPIPAPTGYHARQNKYQNELTILPNAYNLVLMRFAIHEYVGYLWGRIQWNSEKQAD